ncbi:hypothetical protein HPB50_026305 [Hyalomma asiaticum]|uniref:Uncharacterized protein n=1 Tax=Hyalomma asiaticum TaxID=266040 RepID=A0ACB7SZ71_HYAAI|nr:hypothetical protein HPB50_026305 [Hyalomma asiaticum]
MVVAMLDCWLERRSGLLMSPRLSCFYGGRNACGAVVVRRPFRARFLEVSGDCGAFRARCRTLLNKQPLDPTYYSDLTGPERLRYAEKVEMCDRIDPFTLRPGTDTSSDVNEMKAFKSIEAHNYFTSGWVKGLSAKQLQDDKVLLLGEAFTKQRGTTTMTARIVDGVLQSPFELGDYEGISVPQLIRDRLQLYADKVIAIDVDEHLTGSEYLHRIRRCAAGFSREGLKKGTKVCCQLGNSLDNIVAAMGVVFAGGTLVMAKAAFVERELRYEIEDSNCEWILTDAG